MSVKRRLAAAGMPAAGVTVFAVLALTGQPASAAPIDSVLGAPAVCEAGSRIKCNGYGDPEKAAHRGSSDAAADHPDKPLPPGKRVDGQRVDDEPTGSDNDADGSDVDGNGGGRGNDGSDTDNGSGDGGGRGSDADGSNDGSGAGDQDGDGDGRGKPGYGGATPTPTPSASPPGGGKNEVPGGEAPETVPPTGGPRQVSDSGGSLPLTGSPAATISTVGALIAAAGAVAVLVARRRRNA